MIVAEILNLIQVFVVVYALLVTLRVFLSMLGGGGTLGPLALLGRFTDPYLGIFRRLNLRLGILDLSPILAIGLLFALASVLAQAAQMAALGTSALTNPFFWLVLVLRLVWALAGAVIFLFTLGLLLRALALALRWTGQIWLVLDKFYQPLHMKFFRLFTKSFFPYQRGLWILFSLSLVIYITLEYFLVPRLFLFLLFL